MMPCGCKISCGCANHSKQKVIYCPLHTHAEELRDALLEARTLLLLVNYTPTVTVTRTITKCNQAIALCQEVR